MRRLGLVVLVAACLLGLASPAAAVDCISHKFTNPTADGVDTSVVRPSDWNACHDVEGGTQGQLLQRDTGATDGWSWVTAPDIYGPSYLVLTNKTGGALAANDVVAVDTSNDSAVALGDTASSLQAYVVAAESISNNVAGKFYRQGLVTIKVEGAVTRGRYLVKSATTLAAADSGTLMTAAVARPAGTFAVATTAAAGPGAGTVTAYLFGATAPSVGGAGSPGAQFLEFGELATPTTPSTNNLRAYVPTSSASERLVGLDHTGMGFTYSGVFARAANINTTNTAAETTLLTTTIKGSVLNEAGRALHITLQGNLLQNVGTNQGVTFRTKLGGLTLLTLATGNIATSATGHGLEATARWGAAAAGAASSWSATGHLWLGNVGVGGTSVGEQVRDFSHSNSGALGTLDLTTDLTLEVTAQLSTASASLTIYLNDLVVELH